MKKTTILSMLGLVLVAAVFLTAFSVKKVVQGNPEPDFKEFLAQFPTEQLPYSLSENSLRAHLKQYVADFNDPIASTTAEAKQKRLDWKFFQFLPSLDAESSFSRLPMQAEPIALFVQNGHYALLYSASRSYGYVFTTYYIAVLDKKGAQISCNEVGKVKPEALVSANISKDLQAEIKTWRIDWKKDYKKHGLEGNEIKDLVHVETEALDLMTPTPAVERRIKRKSLAPIVELEPSDAKTK